MPASWEGIPWAQKVEALDHVQAWSSQLLFTPEQPGGKKLSQKSSKKGASWA